MVVQLSTTDYVSLYDYISSTKITTTNVVRLIKV